MLHLIAVHYPSNNPIQEFQFYEGGTDMQYVADQLRSIGYTVTVLDEEERSRYADIAQALADQYQNQ